MPSQRCSDVFAFVLQEEGGATYTNDPRDSGGPTKYGVTLATLRKFMTNPGLTANDVRDMTLDTATAIFETNYWNLCQCDSLPPGIDSSVADMAYNAGVDRAVRFLQQAVGVDADGDLGPISMGAIRDADPATVVGTYATICTNFYLGLHNRTYQKGWLNRVAARDQFSLNSIGDSTNPVA